MSRSLRRGAIAALAIAAIVPLAACSAGNSPATMQVTPDSAATSIGSDIKLNNIVVVTPASAQAEYTGPANVTVNISNTGTAPESLKSITVGGAAATFADAQGGSISEIVIPAGGSVLLGGNGRPVAKVSSAKVTVGGLVDTAFTFGQAGNVTAPVNVQPAVAYYADYGPKAEAAPSPKPSASAPAATGSPAASGSPSASATASTSASATAGAGTASGSPSPSAH
ncbi:DUF461 domain-containing protein [Kitasatospora cinereorecta]|uniref:DUF461 domain-containing protein n=1 Tax=Kitasatospora cinereorecta TaxID=285560 RepID=A0ABW0VE36_9ACTN